MKDYKKILEDIVNIINTTEKNDIGFANICTYISENCSELKESEDENIRKWLISQLKIKSDDTNSDLNIMINKAITWLEKQGEQKQDPCVHCDDKCLNCHNFPCIKKRAFEQDKSVFEVINEENADNANNVEPKDYSSIDPHFGKSIDKVRPKFHEGDWVTDGYLHNKITDVLEDRYIVDTKYAKRSAILFDYENRYHLWTINDAKAGDVIYSKHNTEDFEWIGIFKSLDEGAHFYGFWNNVTKTFKVCGNEFFVLYDDFSPATKEQRNMLMEAITEAGYEWDANELEAKKIENVQELAEKNLAWNENDDIMLHDIIDYFENRTLTLPYDVFLYIPWLKSLRNRINCKADKS